MTTEPIQKIWLTKPFFYAVTTFAICSAGMILINDRGMIVVFAIASLLIFVSGIISNVIFVNKFKYSVGQDSVKVNHVELGSVEDYEIPYSRIKKVWLRRGPLDYIFGLANVIAETEDYNGYNYQWQSSIGSSISQNIKRYGYFLGRLFIPGLKKDAAQRLANHITASIEEYKKY